MSLVSFQNVSLNLAGKQILEKQNWQIQPYARIALVGRNGAGKSTLLNVLQGQITPDHGDIHKQSGLRIAGLTQEVPISEQETVYHFLVKELGETGETIAQFRQLTKEGNVNKLVECQQTMDKLQAWDKLPKIETMATRLGFDVDASMNSLSGGMKRRVLLAAALISEPDLLLLDEPTNHLDINTIEWLESYLKAYPGSFVLITHDREFLKAVADQIVEIDRGYLYQYNCDYETFLNRRESRLLSEEKQHALFDKRLSEEEAWIRTGIKARRTRNEGRVRALKAMREQYKQRRAKIGHVKTLPLDVTRSGKLVLEAKHIDYTIEGKRLIKDFSLLLMRGDKVGIVGPNGCGKTTLVRLLLGELEAHAGEIRYGTSLKVAYFDQLRRQLNEQQTVMENIGEGSDFVTIQGKQKHVATYLKEFLFPPETFNKPVSVLSGGERNRLLLAKLFAKPVNLLVMDEPTNDLDLETLELLESMLMDFTGTLLLISHDRAFINHVVTSVLIYEGDGVFHEYVGGYDDYRRFKKQQRESVAPISEAKQSKRTKKLSYKEQRELTQLPQKIEQLEGEIATLQTKMADPSFYQQDSQEILYASQQLESNEKALKKLYQRWEELEK